MSAACTNSSSLTVEETRSGVALRLAYGLAATIAIGAWTLAMRAPLFLDETFSYWQIKSGASQIVSRRGSLSPLYAFILWLATKLTGTSEAGLRAPSFVAMLLAGYLLYHAATRLFQRDVATIVAIMFCLHPLVVYAANDARPYAFALLVTNAAILCLLWLQRSATNAVAVCLGAVMGLIASFQLVFCVIFPALVLGLVVLRWKEHNITLRHIAVALAAFAVTFLPNLPDLLDIFRARQSVVFDTTRPMLMDLFWTLSPWWWIWIVAAGMAVGGFTRRIHFNGHSNSPQAIFFALLGLLPLLTLYCITVNTSTNVFVERYRLVAIPGISLGWGCLLETLDSRRLRALVCLLLVGTSTFLYWKSPISSRHGYTWKYALAFTERASANDHASVVICSDFPNSDFTPMPASDQVKDSPLFAPLSYYPLTSPVVGMPRALNAEAIRVGEAFLRDPAIQRARFLALAAEPSFDSMAWLTREAQASHSVRTLYDSDGMVVLEFTPL